MKGDTKMTYAELFKRAADLQMERSYIFIQMMEEGAWEEAAEYLEEKAKRRAEAEARRA